MGFQEKLNKIEFRQIRELGRADQLEILRIRNKKAVRDYMYTNHTIKEDEHFAWIDGLAEAQSTLFLCALVDGKVAGSVAFRNIDRDVGRGDLGYYLDPDLHGQGLGAALIFKAMDYFLFDLGMKKVNLEVLGFNEQAAALNHRLGFIEEGTLRNHIKRNGEVFDVFLFGLTSDEWKTQREVILNPVPHDSSFHNQIIDQIESVRRRNNANWMDIVRLCFKENPEEASVIFSKILKQDREISDLAGKLSNT